MADEQKQLGGGGLLVLPAFLVWAVVAAGIIAPHPALETARPETASFSERPAGGAETLPARLWQDPLRTAYEAYEKRQAAAKAAKAAKPVCPAGCPWCWPLGWPGLSAAPRSMTPEEPPELQQLCDRIDQAVSEGQAVLLLPVFLPGAPYSEEAENRLRMRYGVLSGLSVAGYVPEDRNHIGHFAKNCSWGDDEEKREAAASGQMIVPFEWHSKELTEAEANVSGEGQSSQPAKAGSKSSSPWEHILVLWIDESQLGKRPLTRLSKIISWLAPEPQELPPGGGTVSTQPVQDAGTAAATPASTTRFEVRVIGPTTSNALVDMLIEFDRDKESPALRQLNAVKFYSPRATISETGLKAKLQAAGVSGSVTDLLTDLHLNRTIADDEQVCQKLAAELELRRSPRQKLDEFHVALIAEWDTAYGRALPTTFAQEYCGIAVCPRVHSFTYLQGIDGLLPGEAAPQGDAERADIAAMERSEGKAQLDYARRLEQHLRRLDARLRAEGQDEAPVKEEDRLGAAGRDRLRAIGILGSDVYDKLLILRALKPSFPGVIFFTTDLDARLLHADEREWTRNLVVGSAFGLQLGKELQNGIPPFRGCYQTAQFFATLRLLEYEGDSSIPDEHPPPRIYEIGRTGPYDLSVDAHSFPNPAGPRQEHWLPPPGLGWILVALVCLLVLVLLLSQSLHEAFRRAREHLGLCACIVLLSVAGTLLAIWVARAIWNTHTSSNDEPFAISEGISIWPTELLRLLALYLSVGYIVAAWWRLDQDTREIHKKFPALNSSSDAHEPLRRLSAILRRVWKIFFLADLPTGDVRELWDAYRRQRAVGARVLRIVVLTAIYVVMAVMLFQLFGFPTAPARGKVSFEVDDLVLKLSVGAMVVLLFLVLDMTRLCGWFVRQLADPQMRAWPAGVRAEEARKLGLLPADVDGWLSVRLIARHTGVVGKFIYGPFIVLFIMFVSRHEIFDHWEWPVALIIVMSFLLLLAIYAALVLRTSAKRARQHVLRDLRQRAAVARVLGQAIQSGRAARLAQLIADIESERGGAFCRVDEIPVLRALLIPSGGIGALAVLQHWLGGL